MPHPRGARPTIIRNSIADVKKPVSPTSRLTAPRGAHGAGQTLREWRPGDESALIASTQDTSIQRFTTMPRFTTEPEWSAWIDARREDALEGRALFLAVETPSGPVGSVNIIRLEEANRKAELGFWLAPSHRGQGIMTIALGEMSRWCFDEYGFVRLELLVMPENEASLRLARRVGYTCEGLLRSYRVYQGRRLDLWCLSLLPEDQIR